MKIEYFPFRSKTNVLSLGKICFAFTREMPYLQETNILDLEEVNSRIG